MAISEFHCLLFCIFNKSLDESFNPGEEDDDIAEE